MPNINDYLILVKGEDKTAAIVSWRYHENKRQIIITYVGGKRYTYDKNNVRIFEKLDAVLVKDKQVLKQGAPIFNVDMIRNFGKYSRVVYKNGYTELLNSSDIKTVDSALKHPVSSNCFEYLKQIAIATGLTSEDGHNILAARYEKIDFVRDDSILASFLNGKMPVSPRHDRHHDVIYPFGVNLSQKQAIDHALDHPLSIIEGPPGTGKTQTILNIIANAVMRGNSVAVVSSNNSATDNVLEKMEKKGIGFLAAPLGNSTNKESFIQHQTGKLPDLNSWSKETAALVEMLKAMSLELEQKLQIKNQLSKLAAERDTLEKERVHFKDYYDTIQVDAKMPLFVEFVSAKKILKFITEYQFLHDNGMAVTFIKKLSWMIQYGILGARFDQKPIDMLIAYCQNLYYKRRLKEIDHQSKKLEAALEAYDFKSQLKTYADLSMQIFRAHLAEKYELGKRRSLYSADDLWKCSEQFIEDYPVILSTTYSLRSSLSSSFVYDYVIIDEASQVDLATGALALSCAKRAVIVGDLKQLPNVVDQKQKKITDDIFSQFDLPEAYRYADHSLLSSAVELFPNAPHVLLREHYRCHPEIIGFCNQRFYHNELIILTEHKSHRQPLMVYKTSPGNHARGRVNQRQIEVIDHEVFPQQQLSKDDGSVGIVTPYRDQANALQHAFKETTVKADTADKFQGQERSVMIFSTVDNEIGDFASDPNRLNVAVSRAIDQFIVVTDGNDTDHTSPIHELIGYIQYHNHEIINSEIHSVFDYLYQNCTDARESILRKYGKVSEFDSENLMYQVIRDVLSQDEFSRYGVSLHVPLRMILSDLKKLDTRELSFATNHLTHVDFLVFSRLTHQPVLVIEVDGFAYHDANDQQKERDAVKNSILRKYGMPILRLSTVGSEENTKLIEALRNI